MIDDPFGESTWMGARVATDRKLSKHWNTFVWCVCGTAAQPQDSDTQVLDGEDFDRAVLCVYNLYILPSIMANDLAEDVTPTPLTAEVLAEGDDSESGQSDDGEVTWYFA